MVFFETDSSWEILSTLVATVVIGQIANKPTLAFYLPIHSVMSISPDAGQSP